MNKLATLPIILSLTFLVSSCSMANPELSASTLKEQPVLEHDIEQEIENRKNKADILGKPISEVEIDTTPNPLPSDFHLALKTAESYSDTINLSYHGMFKELSSEKHGFTPEAALYAVDNTQENWEQNALNLAINYQNHMHLEPNTIHEKLLSEEHSFTIEEANHAINSLPPITQE